MKNPNEMSFLDHLEELRWHLIRSCLSIFLCGIVAFFFKDFIFDTLIFGPKKTHFVTYRFFCDLQKIFGIVIFFASMNCLFESKAEP